MNILETFGIQPILLAAQVVNFLVLLFLLNKFLYKPILKVLLQRRVKIAESLKNAAEIEATLAKTEEDRDKKLQKAGLEAKELIEEAKQSATQIIAEAHSKAADDIQTLVAKTRQELEAERQKLQLELRGEFASIVVSSLEKIAQKHLTETDKQKLTKEAIGQLSWTIVAN